jgi:hypothetical protein
VRREEVSDLGKIDRLLADLSVLDRSTSILLTPDGAEALATLREDLQKNYDELLELVEAE